MLVAAGRLGGTWRGWVAAGSRAVAAGRVEAGRGRGLVRDGGELLDLLRRCGYGFLCCGRWGRSVVAFRLLGLLGNRRT